MLYRNFITPQLASLVAKALNDASEALEIHFNVEATLIYGSVLSEKAEPGNINIFVQLSSVESAINDDFAYDEYNDSLSEEEQMEYFLTKKIHAFVHGEFHLIGEQPEINGKKIDINVCNYEFDYDSESMELDNYIIAQSQLKN